jgi:uncharacterized protein (TIGR03435 family)
MIRTTIRAALGMLASSAAVGQALPPRFDAASVRIAHPAKPHGYQHQINPGGLTMLGVSMGYCIRFGYGLNWQRSYELAGPIWLDPPTDVLVDVVAKTESPASEDQIKSMLQTLLIERFKLAVHREKRSLPAYELVVASNGPVLRKSAPGSEMKVKSGTKSHEDLFQAVSMAQFALYLGPPMTSRPVVDMTGLEGTFDFTLDLGRYMTDPETGKLVVDAIGRVDTEGAIFRGLRDQLGLALRPGRTPVDVLVVDHVEKVPTEN